MAARSQQQHANQPTPSAFGKLLKRLRASANLTQEELAERAGVSARLISDLERGVVQRSRRDTVEMLADGLGLEGTERATFAALSRRKRTAATSEQRAASAPPVKLPAQATSFIGREREVSATTSLLHQPETRLVTLTGPGGVGKTRLAIEAAGRSANAFPDGVVFIDLSSVTSTGEVFPTVGRALELQGGSGAPPLEELATALQDRSILLVLDNMEHLVATAPDLALLIERCPGVKLLVTSRQLLQLRSEREYPVSPLGLPDPAERRSLDALSQTPAVQLFITRAEVAQPAFALTADNADTVSAIVTRLDGLPLAIELAAARMRLLAPPELLQRLTRSLPLLTGGPRDVPDRQQTLRAAIDWSYELLAQDEQRLFTWLGVFTGGFTLDAAEYLAEHMGMAPSAGTLDTLASLVDKNLIQRQSPGDASYEDAPTRFRLLETVREYSLDRLATAPERNAVRRQHAEWCAEFAALSDAGLNSPQQTRWLARLMNENDNFAAGLTWAIEMGESDIALRITGSLQRFWATSGQFREARQWYEQALALPASTDTPARAKALQGIEVTCYFMGDYEGAKAYGKEGLRVALELGEDAAIGWAYGNLGLVADAEEDYERATELYERALAIFQRIGDRTHTHFMLGNLGLIAHLQGNQELATERLEASLALSRELGNQTSVAINLGNLGLVAFARGYLDQALAYQLEALELRRTLGDDARLARSFDDIAIVAAARGDYERATRLFAAAELVRTELETSSPPSDREFRQPHIDSARHALGKDRFMFCWEEGALLPTGDAIEYAQQAGAGSWSARQAVQHESD